MLNGTNGKVLQQGFLNTLVPLLDHNRPAIRKRTTLAVGNLSVHLSDDLFGKLVERLLIDIEIKKRQNDYEKLQTLIATLANLRHDLI